MKKKGRRKMKEITRIITAQITLIETMEDEFADSIISSKEDSEKNFVDSLKKLYRADDVTVEIKDFVLEK